MQIKIDITKNISPGIPKVIPGKEIDTEKQLTKGGLTYHVYEMPFTGKTEKSGQIVVFESVDMYEPDKILEYVVAIQHQSYKKQVLTEVLNMVTPIIPPGI